VGKLQLIPYNGICLLNGDTEVAFKSGSRLKENKITILIVAYHFDSGCKFLT
jgi:hypothetical protein